jgi:UDP-2,3-diacylglucosamine pyrophosphatase LpxH
MTPENEFRILHVSDLHFGAHNAELQHTLKSSVEPLKPHLIIVTGDLADQPTTQNLNNAKELLTDLEGACCSCSSRNAPKVIVTPGNHDKMFMGNLMVLRNPFGKVFEGTTTNFYYPEEGIWVYAMDSARPGIFGANGFVPTKSLADFAIEYQRLASNYPNRFPNHVFKIIALHHHPLPVNESTRGAELQRWLTLMNAGALLGTALNHGVDLILHGHEHVNARSTFRSSFGDKSEVHVVSVGATLKSGPMNFMNLVRIGPDREVQVDTYSTATTVFLQNPTIHPIRSLREARDRGFEATVQDRGYYFGEITSTTILNVDGDCRRIIECDNLSIQKPAVAESYLSTIHLAATTGWVARDHIYARPRRGRILPDFRIAPEPDGTLKLYLGSLTVAGDYSFEYSWWALNSFAMDEEQFLLKYGEEPPPLELTHFHVKDPIEDLTIVIRFPEGFGEVQGFNLQDNLFPCVIPLDTQDLQEINSKRNTLLEEELNRVKAVRYIEALNIAALRIHRPVLGYSYGIGWRVPPISEGHNLLGDEERKIVNLLLGGRADSSSPKRRFLKTFFGALNALVRMELVPGAGELGLSLMMWDESERRLITVAGAWIESDGNAQIELVRNNDFRLKYGEGVAGKAFKNDRYVLWQKSAARLRRSPDFYKLQSGGIQHEFLICFPLRRPSGRSFAVLCIGSPQLYSLQNQQLEKLDAMHDALSEFCFKELHDKAESMWGK